MQAKSIISIVVALALTSVLPGAMAAQTPEASPAASPVVDEGSWRIAEVREFEVEGTPYSLSPDGRWIAGGGPNGAFCVWDVATLEPRCDGEGLNVLLDAIAWAPDSTAVAFSRIAALQQFADSDIFVFDVAEASLRNLTDPAQGTDYGNDAEDPMLVDVFPAWSPDGDELAFARRRMDAEGMAIMRVDRDGGEPDPVIANTAPFIYGPLHWVADDRIFYSSIAYGSDSGVWEAGLDGREPQQILPGGESADVRDPLLIDVAPDGAFFTVYSSTQFSVNRPDNVYAVVNRQTGEVQTFDLATDMASGGLETAPRFSPDGQWLMALTSDDDGTGLALGVWQPGDAGPSLRMPLNVPENSYQINTSRLTSGFTWAENDTVLLSAEGGGVLLTLEPPPGS